MTNKIVVKTKAITASEMTYNAFAPRIKKHYTKKDGKWTCQIFVAAIPSKYVEAEGYTEKEAVRGVQQKVK